MSSFPSLGANNCTVFCFFLLCAERKSNIFERKSLFLPCLSIYFLPQDSGFCCCHSQLLQLQWRHRMMLSFVEWWANHWLCIHLSARCSTVFSAVMGNTVTSRTHSPWLNKVREAAQAGTDAATTKKQCLPTVLISGLYPDDPLYLPRNATAHSGLGSPTWNNNQDNVLPICPQGNLSKTILLFRFPLLQGLCLLSWQ